MPKMSLYKPEKNRNYYFIDTTIRKMFQVGGVDVYVHKYIGPIDPNDPNQALSTTSIQDVVFLENRDRVYDPDVYVIRGHYQSQDVDFNLSQFGLFLQNDTVFVTMHINDSIRQLGRKVMSGDVFEMPNLLDEHALNDYTSALKKFYVVSDVNRAADGFSPTWYPHLYRIKLTPITNSQEYSGIFNVPTDSDIYDGTYAPSTTYYPGQVITYNGELYQVNSSVGSNGTQLSPPDPSAWTPYSGSTIADLNSNMNINTSINDAVVAMGEADAYLSGFDTSTYFVLDLNQGGNTFIYPSPIEPFNTTPLRYGYTGYLVDTPIFGETIVNSSQYGYGTIFPGSPEDGDYYLRIDYMPYRLFRYNGSTWVKVADSVRMVLSNTDTRVSQKASFFNNTNVTGFDPIGSDVVNIDSNGNPSYQTGGVTTSFTIVSGQVNIVTNLPYNTNNVIEVWIDETTQDTNIVISSVDNYLAFTLTDIIPSNSRIRYTVYSYGIQQKQFLTQALKNLKPQADN